MVAMVGLLTALLLLFMSAHVLTPACLCVQSGAPSSFVFTNKCRETIHPAVLTGAGRPSFPTTGFELPPGAIRSISGVPPNWSGLFWARHRCSTDDSGRFSCLTGDCGTGAVECRGAGGAPPATLVEMALGAEGGTDFYDISNVDGFNVPVMVIPDSCATAACSADINAACPPELVMRAPDGSLVGCKSACLAFNRDEFCCRGAFGSPNTCRPSNYSLFFKQRCPQAYSYAFDDRTSTFTCRGGPNYNIIFCP